MTDATAPPDGATPRPEDDVTVNETWHTHRRGRRRRLVVLGALAVVCMASLALVVSSSVRGGASVASSEPPAVAADRPPAAPSGRAAAARPSISPSRSADIVSPSDGPTAAAPGSSPAGSPSSVPAATSLTQEWVHEDVGMIGWSASPDDGLDGASPYVPLNAPPSGRTVLSDVERVYAADGNDGTGTVTSLSLSTGEAVWERGDLTDGEDVFLQVLADDLLIVSGSAGALRAVQAASGEERWAMGFPDGYGPVGSVTVDQTLITTADVSVMGDTRPPLVVGIDLATGRERWRTLLTEDAELQWQAPAAAGDVVVVASTLGGTEGRPVGNLVQALEVGTGAVRWTTDLGGEQAFHWWPTLVGADAAFAAGPEGVVALDLASGDQLWTGSQARTLDLSEDGDLFATAAEGVVRFEADTGAMSLVAGSFPDQHVRWGGTLSDGQLIMVTPFHITAIDPDTGDVLWKWVAGETLVDLPSISGGHIAVPTADGAISLFTLP